MINVVTCSIYLLYNIGDAVKFCQCGNSGNLNAFVYKKIVYKVCAVQKRGFYFNNLLKSNAPFVISGVYWG